MDEEASGGPAFPVLHQREVMTEDGWRTLTMAEGGMSLRDYFAAKAMTLLGGPETLAALRSESMAQGIDPSIAVAHFAYSVADAMLKARKADTP